MGKCSLKLLFAMSLLISACNAQIMPASATPDLLTDTVAPPATGTAGPSTISGEFVLTNTSTPAMEVGVETVEIVLEYRLLTSDPWEKIETDCIFDPPAPLVLNEELVIQYECSYTKLLPPNAQIHTTAEVRIFGSDEVFSLEVHSR
jgi:hypothetical protein